MLILVAQLKKSQREGPTVLNKKRSGQPKKIRKEREARLLTRTSKKDPFKTAREIFNESEIEISDTIRTIQSYLSRSGLSIGISEAH